MIKLANLYNLAAVFSLEPIRVTGDYVAYYAEDTLRRNTFANVRGGLHQPTDESVAIQITGFSISEEGTPNYNGLLACKSNGRHQDVWAFFYCHKEGQTFQLADESVKLRGKKLTEWLGFASRGGSRKKAEASAKQLVRGRVWVSECNAPTLLPLCMGYRQGREYLWNFDRDLRTKDGWVLGNGRLLRITPPDCHRLAEFYLTITLERQAPPLVAFTPEKLIGIDRGEAVPAAYAIIDRKGRLLESGRIAEGYREQQRKFNEAKRDLQRTKGGYTRWLRSKERNRARALGGEVTRALLDLCANHRAPLVLENLGSGPATRGGKGTIMSQMQYERVLTAIEQKLAETGLYALPSAAKFRKRDNGFIKLVGPAYTSSICSACGHLHDSEFYESVAWHVALPTGKSRGLPEAYTYSVRGKGEQTKPTDERIAELLNGKPLAEASQTNRRTLVSLLKSRWLPFRPNQAEFQCVICGHKMNADEQAALNVARKFLFIAEQGTKSGEMSEGERRKMRTKWQAWYVNKLRTDWNSA